jgi:hypothetical protein
MRHIKEIRISYANGYTYSIDVYKDIMVYADEASSITLPDMARVSSSLQPSCNKIRNYLIFYFQAGVR